MKTYIFMFTSILLTNRDTFIQKKNQSILWCVKAIYWSAKLFYFCEQSNEFPLICHNFNTTFYTINVWEIKEKHSPWFSNHFMAHNFLCTKICIKKDTKNKKKTWENMENCLL